MKQGLRKFYSVVIRLLIYNIKSNHLLYITSELEEKGDINKSKIKNFLKDLYYPLYFLDFETMATAIPIANPEILIKEYTLFLRRFLNAILK